MLGTPMEPNTPTQAKNKQNIVPFIGLGTLIFGGILAGFIFKSKGLGESAEVLDFEEKKAEKKAESKREIADEEKKRVMRELAAKGGKKRAENIRKKKEQEAAKDNEPI